MAHGPAGETGQPALHLVEQGLQGLVLHLVAALELTDDQLRVERDVEFAAAEPLGLLQADEQGPVLGDVVRALAQVGGAGGEFPAGRVTDDRAGAGLARVAA